MRTTALLLAAATLLIGAADAQSAVCALRPTRLNADQALSGYINFTLGEGLTNIQYEITGLSDGNHTIHIHTYGSIFSTDGSAVGPHFPGNCSGVCRPEGSPEQTVGWIGDGFVIASQGGVATATFTDDDVAFVGVDSIIGRGIIVHGNADSDGARVAQCVIGRDDDEGVFDETEVSNSVDTREADCVFESLGELSGGRTTGNEAGYARFYANEQGGVDVELWVDRLATDGFHPFEIQQRGNIAGKAMSNGVFMGTGLDAGLVNRVAVGQLRNELEDPVEAESGVKINNRVGSYTFRDQFATLNGANSIVGRALVLLSGTPENDGSGRAPVAQCVVGLVKEGPAPVSELTGVTRAFTVLDSISGSQVRGITDFYRDPEDGEAVIVQYFFTSLTPGNHTWHVHRLADLTTDNGAGLVGHFIGDCGADNPCRPSGLQEIGAFGDSEPIIANAAGEAYGTLVDRPIALNEMHSIVGRGIIVHGDDAAPGTRVSQGVIGLAAEIADANLDDPPPVFEAQCVMRPTGLDTGFNAGGYVRLSQLPGADGVTVTYMFTGLEEQAEYEWVLTGFGNLLSNQNGRSLGDDLQSIQTIMTEGDEASGEFVSTTLQLNGDNSVIGRGFGLSLDRDAGFESYCAIGITREQQDLPIPVPVGARAICTLAPTRLNADQSLTGYFTYEQLDDVMRVNYSISGLSDGAHTVHVHTYGSLHSTDGSATGPHFSGDCSDANPCQPEGAREQTIGWIGEGIALMSTGGEASGSFNDVNVRFAGVNSIVGRGMIVHGNADDSSARVAQCVIGLDNDEGEFPVDQVSNTVGVSEADCILKSTGVEEAGNRVTGLEVGHARFSAKVGGGVNFEIWLNNLRNDNTHPFGIFQRGNINGLGSKGDLFMGNFTAAGSRTNVGDLSPNVDTFNGLIVNGFFGALTFADRVAQLNGPNSIVGRSLSVITGTGNDNTAVAHCVVGIVREDGPPTGVGDGVSRTHSLMIPASNSTVRGTVDFYRYAGEDAITVRYFFTGLAPGDHGWHVHRLGDISSADATAQAGHLIGNCSDAVPCRPATSLQEAGAIEDTLPIVANAQGEAYDVFTDSVIDFAGLNSIVGRGVVVHDVAPNAARRVSQGVIGIAQESEEILEWNVLLSVGAETTANITLDTPSNGTGAAFVRYNPNTRVISWDMTYANLSSPVTVAHFHGPAVRFNTNELQAVMHDMQFPTPSSGFLLLTLEQEMQLRSGLWYINIHTEDNPSGEIRGQIADDFPIVNLLQAPTPAPSVVNLEFPLTRAAADLSGSLVVDNRQATGVATVVYNPNFRLLTWEISTASLTGAIAAAHFHGPASRFDTGGVQITIGNIGDNPIIGSANVTEMQENQLLNGLWYINIHTAQNPDGELRGQVAETEPPLRSDVTLSTDAFVAGGGVLAVNVTGASATAIVTYTPISVQISVSVETTGLSSDVTSIEFRGPARANETAGLTALLFDNTFDTSGITSFQLGSDEEVREVVEGEWYMQVNTVSNPAGELRGNVEFVIDDDNQGEVDPEIETDEDILQAICVFQPTSKDGLINAAGYVMFSRPGADADMTVTYAVSGLSTGSHPWYVFTYGNILSVQDGLSTGQIFAGNGAVQRAEFGDASTTSVGAINNGAPIVADASGMAQGSFVDNFLQFQNANGLVGRSVGIQSLDGSLREAVCTIGILEEGEIAQVTTNPMATTAAPATVAPEDNIGTASARAVSHVLLTLCVAISSTLLA